MKLRFSGLVTTNDWQLLLPFDVDGIDLLKKSGKFEQPHCDVSYGRWWVRGTIPSWSYFRLVNDYHSSRLQYITTSRVNIGGLGILRSHRRVSSRNLHLQGIARSAEFSTAWFPSEFPLLFIWKPLSRKKMEQLWIPWSSHCSSPWLSEFSEFSGWSPNQAFTTIPFAALSQVVLCGKRVQSRAAGGHGPGWSAGSWKIPIENGWFGVHTPIFFGTHHVVVSENA